MKFDYKIAGRLHHRRDRHDSRSVYDGYGRLLTYTRGGDPAQVNAYNGLEDRVSATSGSTTHAYVYDPDGRLLGEYGSSASDVIAETIWLSPEVTNDIFGRKPTF